jgi:hypothetical protein
VIGRPRGCRWVTRKSGEQAAAPGRGRALAERRKWFHGAASFNRLEA